MVGIGASAGGFESIRDFFHAIPSDSGMAFVIVLHLDPTHKGLMPELLQRLPLLPNDWTAGLSTALFGLGALTYVRHPEGIIQAQTTAVMRLFRRRDPDPEPTTATLAVKEVQPA